MPITPEISRPEVPEGVKEIPDAPEIPPHLEDVARPVTGQFTAQVTDDQGQPMLQTPQTTQVTVTIPMDQVQMQSNAKGPAGDSLTWLAVFWMRLVKKAMHFGWRIVSKGAT